jgi:hypothetical protein
MPSLWKSAELTKHNQGIVQIGCATLHGAVSIRPDKCNLKPNADWIRGYLLITNHPGTVSLSVSLADGTAFSQAVPVSSAGDFPVYGNLYGSTGLQPGQGRRI